MFKHEGKQIEVIGNNKKCNIFDLNCPPWVRLTIIREEEPTHSGRWSVAKCPMCREIFSNLYMLHYEELEKQAENDLKSYLGALKNFLKEEYDF
jgi:hypothetical protein